MYYILMVLFDIGFYIAENWRGLTMTALFSAIGMAVGKRIGTKYTVDYIMKRFGLEKKSKLEQQMEHHESEIIKLGGTPWVESGDTKKSWMVQTMYLKKQSLLSQVAKSRLFIRRNQKMREYLRKLGSRKFQSFVVGFASQLFILLKVDATPYVDAIAAGGLIITTVVYIWAEGSKDKAAIMKGDNADAELNIPIEPPI